MQKNKKLPLDANTRLPFPKALKKSALSFFSIAPMLLGVVGLLG